MEPVNSLTGPKPLIAVLLSLFTAGLGHAYCQDWFRAFAILAANICLLLLIYFLPIFGPWAVVVIGVVAVAYAATIAVSAYRQAKVARKIPNSIFCLGYFAVALVGYGTIVRPLKRVQTFVTPSTIMKPTLLPGDHFVTDRFYRDFKINDVVVVELEDRILHARRIQQINSQSVVVTTDSPDHSATEELALTALRGRILYIMYSLDPDTYRPNWERWFVWVH
jgi:hypothetical protein